MPKLGPGKAPATRVFALTPRTRTEIRESFEDTPRMLGDFASVWRVITLVRRGREEELLPAGKSG